VINAKETLDLEHALLEKKEKMVRYILNKRTSSLQPSKTIIFNAVYFCSIDIVTLLYANDFFKEHETETGILASRIGRTDVLSFLSQQEPDRFEAIHFTLLCQSVIAHSRAAFDYLSTTITLNAQEHYMLLVLALILENAHVLEHFINSRTDTTYAQKHYKEIFEILIKHIDPEDLPFLNHSNLHKVERLLRKLHSHTIEHHGAPLPKNFFGKKSIHQYEYNETIYEILNALRYCNEAQRSHTIKDELESLLLFFMARKVLDGHPLNLVKDEAAFEAMVIKNHLLFMQRSPKAQQKKAEKIIQQLQNS